MMNEGDSTWISNVIRDTKPPPDSSHREIYARFTVKETWNLNIWTKEEETPN